MTGYINTIADLEATTYGIKNLPAGNALLKQVQPFPMFQHFTM